MTATILEIFDLSHRVILIAEFEKNKHPKAGMYVIAGGRYFKILSVGVKRNLAHNPKYNESLNEKNILDFDIAKSEEVSICLAVGAIVDVVTSEPAS